MRRAKDPRQWKRSITELDEEVEPVELFDKILIFRCPRDGHNVVVHTSQELWAPDTATASICASTNGRLAHAWRLYADTPDRHACNELGQLPGVFRCNMQDISVIYGAPMGAFQGRL